VTRRQPDAGFTLVELLVVMVIMPLVIGAIAAAIIVSEQDSGVASSRLSDSASAQVASEYYVRDVQGAQYVTTTSAVVGPNQVCVNPALSSPKLVLGLDRTAGTAGTSAALSIGYWVTGGANPELVRDSCSSPGTFTDEVPLARDIDPTHVAATIVPAQFASGAAAGWTPTTATTAVSMAANLSAGTLPVSSTNGFVASSGSTSDIGVRSTTGYQMMPCTVASPTSFSCSGGSGQVSAGAPVRQQDSISNITISVTEPGSGYTYSLQATPRVWTTKLTGKFGPGAPFAAALVTLDTAGTGDSLTGGSIQVDGMASFGGSLTASAGASLTATAAVNTNGQILCSGGATVKAGVTSVCGDSGGAPTTDPLAPLLVGATPQGLATQACPSFGVSPTTLSPGIYTCELNIPASAQVILNPGVYELQNGIAVAGSASLTGTGGALLYLTCPTGQPTCTEPDNFAAGSSVSIAPLTATQSTTFFPTLGTPALQDVWLWQDSGVSAGASSMLVGNGSSGVAYLPGAVVNLSNNSGTSIGRIVARNITMSQGSLTVTGQ
jgi:type II secretory pathway pseudopilin PulG